MKIRVGFGYDVHPTAENRKLWIGGIRIESSFGLMGHSDADVLIHALCDALLGAANLRDIGFHFPDNDKKYEYIDSKILLRETMKLVREKGFEFGNADCTIVAESPKLNPYIPMMQKTLSEVMQVDVEEVSIKATTNEKKGFIGRKEGIAAFATVLLISSKDVVE
jgi:2-C-methyl-D-erythritol 2,4-cyclodiphosphate synthase